MRCGMSNGTYYAKSSGLWARCREDRGRLHLEWHYRVMDHPDRIDFLDPLGVVQVSVPKRGFMEYPSEMWQATASLSLDGAGFREVPSWLKRSELVCTIQRHSALLFSTGFTPEAALESFADPFSAEAVQPTSYYVRNGWRQFEGLDGATIRVEEADGGRVAVITTGAQVFDVDLTDPLVAEFLISTEPVVWSR